MAVAVLLKCDDPAWRDTLYAAAGHAVHQAVGDTPPPANTTPDSAAAAAPSETAPPVTPDEIVAATTPADRALLDGFTKRALQVDAVQQAVLGDDPALFGTTFNTAVAAAISNFSLPDQVVDLGELHANPAFRAGLTTLVWTTIAPTMRAELHGQQPVGEHTAAAAAAAVAAQAFLPTGGRPGAVPSTAPPRRLLRAPQATSRPRPTPAETGEDLSHLVARSDLPVNASSI